MTRVSIFTDGLPHSTATLPEFFTSNDFPSEDLQAIFEAFAAQRAVVFGGGAEPLFAVKLYELGDERKDIRDVLQFQPHCYGLEP